MNRRPPSGGAKRGMDWALGLQRIGALILVLAVWQAAVALGLLPSMTPDVFEVVGAIATTIVNPTFWLALGETLSASMTGWLISCVVGILLGLLIGSIRFVDDSTSLVVEFGRAFPVIALMPIVVMLLGTSLQMRVTIVVLAAVWPILVQSIVGARRLDPSIVDTAKIFRIPSTLRFRRVVLPSALPFIATGVRISASIAILVEVGTEVIVGVPGLGRLITLAQEAQRWDLAFAYLFFTGIVGWGIASLLALPERRLLRWSRQSDD